MCSHTIILTFTAYAFMMVTLLSPILSEGPTGPVLSTATTACITGFGSELFSANISVNNCTFSFL